MKNVLIVVTILLGLWGQANADEGAELFKKCAGCHGQQGQKSALGKSKIIKDMTKAEIETALKGYKDGTYGGASKGIMKNQASSLNDNQIKAIATSIGK